MKGMPGGRCLGGSCERRKGARGEWSAPSHPKCHLPIERASSAFQNHPNWLLEPPSRATSGSNPAFLKRVLWQKSATDEIKAKVVDSNW